jgi:hypothetical protein
MPATILRPADLSKRSYGFPVRGSNQLIITS